MKKTGFKKKLDLNKKTISNLSSGFLGQVHGGDHPTTTGVPFCEYSCVTCRATFCDPTCVTCETDCGTCISACSNGWECC